MNAMLIPGPDRYPVTYDGSDEMDEIPSTLPADLRNLQIHVADIKGEVRAANAKIDSLRDRVEQYRVEDNKRIDARFEKVDARFERVDARFEEARQETKEEFAAVRGEIGDLRKEMKTEFTTVRTEMQSGFAALRTEMQAGFKEIRTTHRLACGILFTAILGAIAHGFKWF